MTIKREPFNKRIYNSTILESGFYLQLFDEKGDRKAIAGFREIMEAQWYIKSKIYNAMMEFGILDQYGRLNVPFEEVPGRFYWGCCLEHSFKSWTMKEVLHHAIYDAKWIELPDWVKILPKACVDNILDEISIDCELRIPRIYQGRRHDQDGFTFIAPKVEDQIKDVTLDLDVKSGTHILGYHMDNFFDNPVELCFQSNTVRMNQILERIVTGDPCYAKDVTIYVGVYHKLKADHKLLFTIFYTRKEGDET